MKVCPLCKSDYEDWIDFCFNDGIPLVLKAEGAPVAEPPVAEAAAQVAAPTPVAAPAPTAAPLPTAPPGATPAMGMDGLATTPVTAPPAAPLPVRATTSTAEPAVAPFATPPVAGAVAASDVPLALSSAIDAPALALGPAAPLLAAVVVPTAPVGAPSSVAASTSVVVEEARAADVVVPPNSPPDVDDVALGELAAVLRDTGTVPPAPPAAPPVVERVPPRPPPEPEIPWADSPEPTGNAWRWVVVGGVALFGFFGAVAVALWLFSQTGRPPTVAAPPPLGTTAGSAPTTAAPPAAPAPFPAAADPSPTVAALPTPAPTTISGAATTPPPATVAAAPLPAPVVAAPPSATARTAPPPAATPPAAPPAAAVPTPVDISPPAGPPVVADAAPAEAGVLHVLSDPDGASVYVNEQARGKTPLALELPYGSYRIRLVLAGYKTEVRDASLRVGDYTVPFKLKPEVVTGQVNVYAPVGYRVVVDGHDVGPTPVTVQVSEGTRQFKLVAADGTSCVIPKQVTFNPPGTPQTVMLQCP